jgi:hypothetical protein
MRVLVGCRLDALCVRIPPVHTVCNTPLSLACYKRYALASPTRPRTPACESRINSGRGGGKALSLKGAAVPSTGSGAGTASSATPSQSSKGSLEPPWPSLDPGALASTTSIGPAELLHFTCSTHVAPGERFFCHASYGTSVVRRPRALHQAAILVFPVLLASNQVARCHFSHGCP